MHFFAFFAGMSWLERDYNVDSCRPDFIRYNVCAFLDFFCSIIVKLKAADKFNNFPKIFSLHPLSGRLYYNWRPKLTLLTCAMYISTPVDLRGLFGCCILKDEACHYVYPQGTLSNIFSPLFCWGFV